MGKPGGFFKRLKAKQKRSASRQRRGTKGASKEERRRKREEKATYFAARREAEQLAAISSSSDDEEENDDNVHTHAPRGRRNGGRDGEEELSDGAEGAALRAGERKLRRLRALLGVHTEGQKRPRHHHHRHHHRNHNENSTKAPHDGASDDEGSVFAASSEEDDDDTASLPFADTDSEASEEAKEDVSDDDGDVRHEEDEGDEDEDDEDGLLIEDDAEEEEGLGEDNPLLALDENEDEDDAADLFAQVEAEGKNNNNNEEEEANDEEDEEDEEQSEKEDAYFDEDEDSDAEEEEESTRHNKKRKKAAAQAAAPSSAEDGEGVLLEKFVLGTSSLRTIVQSTKIDAEDNWLRKYHCDEHGEVDETPLVPLPLSELATRQLQHSNDVLIERAARTAEQEQGRHTSSTAQDPFVVHAEDYGTVHPENVTIAATAHARAHLLHPPFELPEDSTAGQVPPPSQSMKTTTMWAESEEAMKGSAVCEERPSYMHEVLWQKWVAFRAQTQRPVFTNEERGLLDLLQGYADLMDCLRCWQNGQSRREIFVLHMLNHWFKARAVVMAHEKILQTQRARRREQQKQEKEEGSKHTNNTKKKKSTKDGSENARKTKTAWVDAEDFELRDRGFGRTRLLVMLPMRNIAYRYVETLVAILGAAPAQCPKLELFRSDFSEVAEAVDRLFGRRAMDYQRQFEGNIDDAFCVGLRLEPQRVHVYAHPLNSDIILCSPLGLRRRLEKAADIVVSLSSIEVCVMDEAHVLLAQNWQHVTAVLELLNKRPTDTTHGLSDLRRVYACALEGKSGRHRQTIVCSNFTNATLLSTFRAGRNNSGKVVLQHRSEAGVVARVAAPLLRQHFVRFSPRDVQSVDEERFAYFTEQLYASKIHPLIERGVRTILFVPSYFDFVRLRQYMHREHRESYAAISEYTPAKAQRRALGQFSDCERPLLLLTERFYFFRRYFVKLAEVMVFYSPPLFADFYVALLDRLVASSPNAFALTLYCRYDSHELNRIVGTARLQQMLQRESSIVSFVTS